ncbi:hypothetical protein QE152_g5239 [Popillia japonica]|uniref:Uncharacterized protein n=1 Tax=Popillia japonica TaxID=7064 RepID=A0AAW1MRE1_POPJA
MKVSDEIHNLFLNDPQLLSNYINENICIEDGGHSSKYSYYKDIQLLCRFKERRIIEAKTPGRKLRANALNIVEIRFFNIDMPLSVAIFL